MRGHSIESAKLPPRSQQRLTSEAPEAYNSICGFFPKADSDAKPALRRCESASVLARRPKSCANPTTQRLGQLEIKYRALEDDYRRVLLEVRSRADLFVQQKEEIERLTQATLREEREIARLKQMLRLTEKRSLGVQTEER